MDDPKIIETISVWKDPLGYPWATYLWVVAIACAASVVKHINSVKHFKIRRLLVDLFTAGFMGVVAFWLCEAREIRGPMSAVAFAVAGAMGNRFLAELENIWRIKFGLKAAPKQENPPEDESAH